MDKNVFGFPENIWVGYAHEGLRIKETDVCFYNVKQSPISVHGLCNINENFHRIPDGVAETVSCGVVTHNQAPAGGRIRFATDSPYVALRCKHKFCVSGAINSTRLAFTGFDMYVENGEGKDEFVHSYYPALDMPEGYEGCKVFGDCKMRQITVNMPLLNEVYDVEIGVKKGSRIEPHRPYKTERPVVFYGSSITHGIAASRPGNTYEGFISRRLDCDYINLGFSGNCKGEPSMAGYIAGLDMSAFVLDYDHNAPDTDHLLATHYSFYKTVRDAQPELPIIMVTRPDSGFSEKALAYKDIIMESYLRARNSGDKNVWFVDGSTFFKEEVRTDCTVDGTHPNDMGFCFMAERIGETLRYALAR